MKILNVKLFNKKALFKKSALAAMLTVAMSQSLAAAGLTASLSSDTVGLGEAFELTIATAESDVQSLDLAALKQHFNLIGSSQSMRTQIINGQRSAEKSWRLTLTAKDLGEFTLPAISAGQYSSNPLALKVVAAAQQPKAVGVTGVSMKVEISDTANKQFYPFQEIPIKVRIETNQALQQAELIVPKNADLELSQLGEDSVSQTVKNGQRLQVIEREYVLKPQVSGSLTLPPFVLRGKVANQRGHTRSDAYIPNHLAMMREFSKGFGFGSGFSSGLGSMLDDEFGFMGSGAKPFQVRTEPLKLEVAQAGSNTASAQQKNWFLPAKKLEVTGKWQENPAQMKVGQAIVRKITLTALGVTPEQLPNLSFKKTPGLKIYIDSRQTSKVASAQGNIARSETWISIVPTKAGELELPAIEVPWMNTQTNTEETAVLPAQRLQVTELASHATQQPKLRVGGQQESAGNADDLIKNVEGDVPPIARELASTIAKFFNLTHVLYSLLAASLIVLGFFTRKKWLSNASPSLKAGALSAERGASELALNKQQQREKMLKQALTKGDLKDIYRHLIAWQRLKSDPQLDDKLAKHLHQLEQALYQGSEQASVSYDIKPLKLLLKKFIDKPAVQQQVSQKELPALYPSSY